jgi:hypothetical protein
MVPRCLAGFDDVVVQGANGVCGAPEALAGGPSFAMALLAAGVVVAIVVGLRAGGAGARARTWGILAFVAIGGAWSGWLAIARRADAPQRMEAFAAAEALNLGEVERTAARAGATGCVRSVSSACPACEPMLHMAAPTRHQCESDVAHVRATP